MLDEGAVEAAMRGKEAVLSALGHKRYFYPTRILSQGTRNVLRAMETHGVPRLVCETSLGIGDSAGRMGLYYTLFVIPVILPFYFWDKTRQERMIAGSNVEWVIVRPGVLTNGDKRGRGRHWEGATLVVVFPAATWPGAGGERAVRTERWWLDASGKLTVMVGLSGDRVSLLDTVLYVRTTRD